MIRHEDFPWNTDCILCLFSSSQRFNVSFPERGHGAHPMLQLEDVPYVPTYRDTPIVEEYFRHCYAERQRRLGQRARLMGSTGTVFPNMSILSRQPRSIAVWHPRQATQTEAWRWFLVDGRWKMPFEFPILW